MFGFRKKTPDGRKRPEVTDTTVATSPDATPEANAPPREPPALDAAPAPSAAPDATPNTTPRRGLFARLRDGMRKTRGGFSGLFRARAIDDELLEELETRLLLADVGIETVARITGALTARLKRHELADGEALLAALREEMATTLAPCDVPLPMPPPGGGTYVLLMVGVNGAGKTTTIGKLARRFRDEGRSVMLAAGDTFRAAAVEQLAAWGARNDVPVIAQATGADSASVIFDALQSARARGIDVLIADTAGRLHTQANLMDELKKILRVMKKLDPDAPHEVMLVVDAGTGQNALAQAEQFNAAVGVTGIALTKLDGTAKGGIVLAIAARLGLPIRFIGVGEQVDDLRPFAHGDFIDALLAVDDAA